MKVASKYEELIVSRIEAIINKEELPVPFSELIEKKHDVSFPKFIEKQQKNTKDHVPVRCYCNKCGHELIKPTELVYDVYPKDKQSLAFMKAECVRTYW